MVDSGKQRIEGLQKCFNSFQGNGNIVYYHIAGDLKYSELYTSAVVTSKVLAEMPNNHRSPVLVYGHKDRRFLIAYWACLLSGRAIVPIESGFSKPFILRTAAQCGATLLLDATSFNSAPDLGLLQCHHVPVLDSNELHDSHWVERDLDDDAYIMFSSGTTDAPKGIRISYHNLIDFVGWVGVLSTSISPIGTVTSNVRFCFDVSLFEMWFAWLQCVPMVSLDYEDILDTRLYLGKFRELGLTTWISTPSLARCFLADSQFAGHLLPSLKNFLFCGEVLPKQTVRDLWRRFPGCVVINTYGPTECTVAVTSVRIDQQHMDCASSLPIGYVRSGTQIDLEPNTDTVGRGELLISGHSVGLGYIALPEIEKDKFPRRGVYRTGDIGRVDETGLWYFEGRIDREVKVQGVRIDLNACEAIARDIPGVTDAMAQVWTVRGEARAVKMFVWGPTTTAELEKIACHMADILPKYLVPRFWYAIPGRQLSYSGKLQVPSEASGVKEVASYVFQHA